MRVSKTYNDVLFLIDQPGRKTIRLKKSFGLFSLLDKKRVIPIVFYFMVTF